MSRTLLVSTLVLACSATWPSAGRAAPLLFRNVRIFDGTAVSQGDVLVEKGLIRAVGRKLSAKGPPAIDGTGKTLLPGFTDAHTHPYEDKALTQALITGRTTEPATSVA